MLNSNRFIQVPLGGVKIVIEKRIINRCKSYYIQPPSPSTPLSLQSSSLSGVEGCGEHVNTFGIIKYLNFARSWSEHRSTMLNHPIFLYIDTANSLPATYYPE